MDEILKILGVISLAGIIVLVIYLMIFLSKSLNIFKNVSNNFNKISENITAIKTRAFVTFDEISEVKKDINELKNKSIESMEYLDETNKSTKILIDGINNTANDIRNTIKPYEDLANNTYEKIAPPIKSIASFVSAMTKGINAFRNKMGL